MLEFFRGWKRKLGSITLLMACLLMASAVRGRVIEDHIRPGSGKGKSSHEFIFSRTGITWLYESTTSGEFQWLAGWSTADPEWEYSNTVAKWFALDPKTSEMLVWRWRWLGFDAGKTDQPEGPENYNCQEIWIHIHYWLVVVPLALLSAWLFLSRPRPKRETPISTTDEVA